METIKMTRANVESFLDWIGNYWEQTQWRRQIEDVKKYPSLAEETMPRFAGMARLCAKYNLQPDHRKAIDVL